MALYHDRSGSLVTLPESASDEVKILAVGPGRFELPARNIKGESIHTELVAGELAIQMPQMDILFLRPLPANSRELFTSRQLTDDERALLGQVGIKKALAWQKVEMGVGNDTIDTGGSDANQL